MRKKGQAREEKCWLTREEWERTGSHGDRDQGGGEERVRWGGVPNKHHREMWAKRVGTEWGNVAGGEGRIDVCV